MLKSLLATLPAAAFYGWITWMVYAVVEFAVSCLGALMFLPNTVFPAWNWGYMSLVLLAYSAAGILLGAAATGAVLAIAPWTARSGRLAQTGAIISLLAAFAVNLLRNFPLGLSDVVALTVAILLVAGVVWRGNEEKYSFLTNPWAVSALLLVPATVTDQVLTQHGLALKVAAAVTIVVVVMFACVFARGWLTIAWPQSGDRLAWRRAAILAGFAAVVLVATTFFNRPGIPDMRRGPSSAVLPNVILLVLDTVRADHLSVYDYHRKTTPRLEELARESTVYTQAVSPADMTLPTHASLFTGMYTSTHGAGYVVSGEKRGPVARPIPAEVDTLAEILARNGYFTAAVAANRYYLLPEFGFAQGFHLFNLRRPLMLFGTSQKYFLRLAVPLLSSPFVSPTHFDHAFRPANEINEEAFRILDRLKLQGGNPFFLFMNYMDAHTPYLPPAPYDSLFPGKDPSFTRERYTNLRKDVMLEKQPIPGAVRAHLESQYDGAIAFLDAQIGQLLDRLKSLDLYRNTLIVVTSDHGEAFGDKFVIGHSSSVYQDVVRVPLIVRYPKQTQAQTVDQVASGVDVLPTVMDVAGLQIAKVVQGVSLRRLGEYVDRLVIAESYFPPPVLHKLGPAFNRVERALYSGSLKLISSTRGKRELYDLSRDPREMHNLFRVEDRLSLALQSALNEWVKQNERISNDRFKVDPKLLERLRSLGYVQ